MFNVPFIENPNEKCVPTTIGMVLAYFYPEKNYSLKDLEEFTGYKPGQGTWSTESMIKLKEMGLQTKWIEDFDHLKFSEEPEAYLRTILDDEAYDYQTKHSNLQLEAKRLKDYLEDGNRIEQRAGTIEDIKKLIDEHWLVRLEVNANTLADTPGYDGHSVLVLGYDEESVTLHNPDGVHGNKPYQKVEWDKLYRAWKDFGGSFSIYAFKA